PIRGYEEAMKSKNLMACLLALAAVSCQTGGDVQPIVIDLSAAKTPAATATPSPPPAATPTPVPAAAAPAPAASRAPQAQGVIADAPPPAYDSELTNYAYPRPVRVFALHDQRQDLKMAYILAEPSQPNGRSVLLLH